MAEQYPLLTLSIRYEHDVVLSRQRARTLAALLGFDPVDQTRISTAVSEIARNAFAYAGRGEVRFEIVGSKKPQEFRITVEDTGPGIPNLKEILEGRYQSATGMGSGILGSKRLMDTFQIQSIPGKGTTVHMGKLFPNSAPLVTPELMGRINLELGKHRPQDPFQEIQQQNQELIRAMNELQNRQEQLERLNQELADTNRGVVALYAELEEKAASLQSANEIKTRFLSNMSHEFRTPLNTILSLAQLLLDRVDGELSEEQEKQVLFIKKAAENLSELINDLLDLAKIEAGKTTLTLSEFSVKELFSILRGMLKPILVNPAVALIFEDPNPDITVFNDEGTVGIPGTGSPRNSSYRYRCPPRCRARPSLCRHKPGLWNRRDRDRKKVGLPPPHPHRTHHWICAKGYAKKSRRTSTGEIPRKTPSVFLSTHPPIRSTLDRRLRNTIIWIMIPERVQKVLEAHGLQALEFEPGSTPTAEMAASRIGVQVGQIAKSILLHGKDGKYRMVVLAGDKKLQNNKLKALFGVKTSMAGPEETLRVTGFPPGGVCPFGLDGTLEIYLDKSLEKYETIYPAAGTDSTGVPCTFRELLEITGAALCDVAAP